MGASAIGEPETARTFFFRAKSKLTSLCAWTQAVPAAPGRELQVRSLGIPEEKPRTTPSERQAW